MKRLINYFIKNPFSGNVLMILIFLLGLAALGSIRSTPMPQVAPGLIQVTVNYPGSSPEEIEKGIILKIETALKSVSGIDNIYSFSTENTGNVVIMLDSGFNADVVLQDVKNEIDGIISFPSGMEPPNVKKMEFRGDGVQFALCGDVDLRRLKESARVVEDDLRSMEGISKVELSGFPDEEIEIAFRENDLERLNLTLDEAFAAVKNANIDITGGTMRGRSEELRVRAKQKQYYAADMENIVLRSTESGAMVRLKDVALVSDKWAENPNRSYINGKPAVVFTIKYTSREDIIHISNAVKAYSAQFNQADHQSGNINIIVFNDRSDDIKTMTQILVDNGILGFFLVLLFLSFALNFRLSFWVAISIPLAFLGMFVTALMVGITINKVSLFGMILVVGILVDDGIVIAENIYSRHESGESNLSAALNGTMEVLPAVFSAVLTTIVAFAAFFFLDGMMGKMFAQLALVVIASLAFSLIESAFILPGHIAHSKALQQGRKPSRLESTMNNLMSRLRDNIFKPALKAAVNNKILTMVIPIGLLLITMGAFRGGIIKSGDPNAEDNNFIRVNLEMPAGTVQEETMKVLSRLENAARQAGENFNPMHDEDVTTIKSIVKNIGPASKGSVTVMLQDSSLRNFHSNHFANAMMEIVGEVPQAERIDFVQESHFGKAISLSILSNNLKELEGASKLLKVRLKGLLGLKNIMDDHERGMREVIVTLKDKAYLLGLDVSTVMNLVRKGIFGYEVQRLHRGMDEVKIWVRLQKDDRSTIGSLENMRIRLKDGRKIPLKEVADLKIERNLSSILHLNGRRKIKVEADVIDKSVSINAMQMELKDRIMPELKERFPSISFHWGGRVERLKKTNDSAKIVVPIALLLLLTVIMFTFRSFTQTFLIFLTIPFGFIGVGWGHAIHGLAVDMPSMFGIVALLGIMINDGIVLISTVNNLAAKGTPFDEAVTEATVSRFRPILLTSLTTIAGLAPLILADSSEAHIVIPMAIAVAYGLMVATFITLFMLPVMLLMAKRIETGWKIAVSAPSRFLEKKLVKVSITVLLLLGLGIFGLFAENVPPSKKPETNTTQSIGRPLTLEQALEKGLTQNFQVRIAAAEKSIAANNNSWGTAGRYPVVNTGAEYANSFKEPLDSHTLTTYLDMKWTLFEGFKVKINKAKLSLLEQQGITDAEAVSEQVVRDITMGYYNVLLEQEKLKIAGELESLSKDRYVREQEKQRLGSSSTYEVLRARTAWLEDRSVLLLQQASVDTALRDLNGFMGNLLPVVYHLTGRFESVEMLSEDVETLRVRMTADNKTLKNLRLYQQLLTQDVKLQKSAWWPKVTLNSGYRRVTVLGNSANDAYVNVGISANLFNGGNRRRAVANAAVSKKIGRLQLEETQLLLTNRLDNAYQIYEARRQVLEVSQEQVKSAALSLQLSEEKFKSGAIDSFNYRDVQLNYRDAALKKLEAVYNLIDSSTGIKQLTGNIFN